MRTFNDWWRASKYCQVMLGKREWEQIARDGWNACEEARTRPWMISSLTDEEIGSVWSSMGSFLDSREADYRSFARAIERAIERKMRGEQP